MRAAARAEEEEASISFVQVYSTLTSLSLSLSLSLSDPDWKSFFSRGGGVGRSVARSLASCVQRSPLRFANLRWAGENMQQKNKSGGGQSG